MDAYLFGRELTVMNHSIMFSSIRSDINQINKYKIELVFFPYDIVFYFYGHSQKKRRQYSCNICTKRTFFSPLSFCYETIVDHQTKYGILKKNTFSSYSDKNCMFKMGETSSILQWIASATKATRKKNMIRNVDDFTLFTYSFRSVLFRCEFLLIRNHSGPSGSLQIWCIDYINYCKSLQLRPIFTAIVRYFPSSIFHKLHRNTTKIILYNSSKFNFLKQLIDMI